MRTARLFQTGGSQAVRLPKEFRFESEEVFVKRVGNAVVLIPVQDPWRTLVESLDEFSADFMAQREQPNQHAREAAFE